MKLNHGFILQELEQSLKTRLILENKVKGLEKELEKFGALEYDFQMLKMKEKERDVLEKWEEIQVTVNCSSIFCKIPNKALI